MTKYIQLTYYPQLETNADGSTRLMREFKTRDGLAFIEVQSQLPPPHFLYKGTYENIPRDAPPDFPSKFPAHDPAEFGWLDDTDLLILTIRPPISDDFVREDAKRTIPRSYSWLECTLLNELQTHFFRGCSRDLITISKSLHDRVPSPHRIRKFLQNGVAGSWYPRIQPRCTSGYVAFLPKTNKLPAVMNIFGMGGNDTLRTAHLLRVHFPDLLASLVAAPRPRLLIFEMSPPDDFDEEQPLLPGLLQARYERWKFGLSVDTM
ncbi:MAG TPA: hypothetical protein VI636_09690 [Candidatus Angelobacter sp.]